MGLAHKVEWLRLDPELFQEHPGSSAETDESVTSEPLSFWPWGQIYDLLAAALSVATQVNDPT
jgi:hypothetical protein